MGQKKNKENGKPSFAEISSDIVRNSRYLKLKEIYHHKHSVYEHTRDVAESCYRVGSFLNRIIRIELYPLTRGALLHDFFLYHWRREKSPSGEHHAFAHPKEALKNAEEEFSPLSDIEKNIILSHMWPLTIHPPRYREAWIVTVVDKIVATKEFIHEFLQKPQY